MTFESDRSRPSFVLYSKPPPCTCTSPSRIQSHIRGAAFIPYATPPHCKCTHLRETSYVWSLGRVTRLHFLHPIRNAAALLKHCTGLPRAHHIPKRCNRTYLHAMHTHGDWTTRLWCLNAFWTSGLTSAWTHRARHSLPDMPTYCSSAECGPVPDHAGPGLSSLLQQCCC